MVVLVGKNNKWAFHVYNTQTVLKVSKTLLVKLNELFGANITMVEDTVSPNYILIACSLFVIWYSTH